MAVTATLYTHTRKLLAGELDWTTETLKLALVTSSYTPNVAHTIWADVSANEVATGDGYTTGGATLGNLTKDNSKLDADDVTFTGLTKTFRYGVIYAVGTIESLVNPLIGYYLFDNTPADITISGTNFQVIFNANGVFNLSP